MTSSAVRERGLTVIEVLVGMTILAIISAALLGTFSSIVSMNRDASRDIDYSRVVRTVVDRTKLDWELPSEWESGSVGNVSFSDFVDVRSRGECSGSYVDDPVTSEVRQVTIVCSASGDLGEQAFEVEFGAP